MTGSALTLTFDFLGWVRVLWLDVQIQSNIKEQENTIEVAQKLKVELPEDLAVSLAGIAMIWLSMYPKLLW